MYFLWGAQYYAVIYTCRLVKTGRFWSIVPPYTISPCEITKLHPRSAVTASQEYYQREPRPSRTRC